MKKAIILAAGVGSRIKKYHEKPKALLEFGKNKITIIDRQNNTIDFELKDKSEVAKDIVSKIIELS